MSIFTKDCPVCAATHSIQTVRCGCGYCFDPNKVDGITAELEVLSQDEKLYMEYLAARATQAEEEMRAAKTAAAANPDNTVKASEALLAEQNALTARAEYEAQRVRAHAVKERVKVVRAGRRSRRAAKSPAPAPTTPARSKPASVRETLAPPKNIAPRPARPASVVLAAPQPATVTKPRTAPAKPFKQPAPVVKPAPPPEPSVPLSFDKPTPAFRASQSNRAGEVRHTPKPNVQECPHCSATLRPGTKRCGCGFEISAGGNDIPGLALSPEEQAAFLAALSPVGNDRNN